LGHDASRTGAPILLLEFLRWADRNTSDQWITFLGRGGPLVDEYRQAGPTLVATGQKSSGILPRVMNRLSPNRFVHRLRRIMEQFGPELIYVNSVASVPLLGKLRNGKPFPPRIIHVHELESMTRRYSLTCDLADELCRSQAVIAASQAVKDSLAREFPLDITNIEIIHEYLCRSIDHDLDRTACRTNICQKLEIDPGSKIVVSLGTVGWRKSPESLIHVAKRVLQKRGMLNSHFVWVGNMGGRQPELLYDAERMKLQGRVHFVGESTEPLEYLAAADVFALTSREDPYPLAMLEAALMKLPIVCFDHSGGAPEFVQDDCGYVVPYLDHEAMAACITKLLRSDDMRSRMGTRAREKVLARHTIEETAPRIHKIMTHAVRM
jgi:glycosyltransferase involved in cell wall biosynthesis